MSLERVISEQQNEIDRLKEMLAAAKEEGRREALGGAEPVAWRVMVRDSKTEWRQYALYETEKAAQNTVKKVEGAPLQVRAEPLYAAQPA